MSATLDDKVHMFSSIMKSVGYTEKINSFTIRSLIEIPDIKEFFDWFLLNVNENWFLSSEQKFWFKEKEAKGQVVYDLVKLVNTNRMIKDDQNVNQADIEQENERQEEELAMLENQFEFKQKHRAVLNEELARVKKSQYDIEIKDKKLESVLKYKQSKVKSINTRMNKSLMEFQSKLGNEEKFNQKIFIDLGDIEASIENYIQNEKQFMSTIKDLLYTEFDYNNLSDGFSDLAANRARFEQGEKEMKIVHSQYPGLIATWLSSNIGFKVAQSTKNEMNKILSHTKEFFEYTQEQLELNEKFRDNIQSRIAQNQEGVAALKDQLIVISSKIEQTVQLLSDLKVEKLLHYDMDQRKIELNLFKNKQEKLSRLINAQTSRVKVLDLLGHVKLNELETLKSTFEELIQNKSLLISYGKSNQSMLTSSSLYSTTIQNINTTQTPMNNNQLNSFYNTSFSASMANLLSSTAFPGSSPPKNMRDQFAITPVMRDQFAITPTNTKNSNQTENSSSPQELWHILNKLLISILTSLRCNESIQKLLPINNQISVNFSDNLESLVGLYETVTDKYKSIVNVNIRQSYERLYALIEKTIAYCYLEDKSGKPNPYLSHKYDFSNIKLVTAKFLEEPLSMFGMEQEELECEFIKLLKVINAERNLLSSNNLEVLKRNLFVYFVNKPQLMEYVVTNLNQIC